MHHFYLICSSKGEKENFLNMGAWGSSRRKHTRSGAYYMKSFGMQEVGCSMCVKATWLDVHSNGGHWALLVLLGLPAVACCIF